MSTMIDLTYLKSICDGDTDFMNDMIETFLQGTPDMIKQMKEACQSQDWARLGALAHKVKPSISFMGISSLEALILEIEHSGKDAKNLDKMAGMVEEFEQGCEAAYVELREVMETNNA
ncbi:Hpt domain-containing protein [Persicobacter psychrovividus]|uniref:HPt domain-containing protein n=1 Tax=Persicobacter psychrovividus TaxID=387638 RepID=A0ABM7VEK9_9BACT|nr:hypothetical protein PEPS_16460 [Persicobacter psychrovividus]